MNSWEHLKNQRGVLATLRAIVREADPAAGISFMVRRGVLHDDPDNEAFDAGCRPFVEVEFGNFGYAVAAVGQLIKGVEDSIRFTERQVRDDIAKAQKALDEG